MSYKIKYVCDIYPVVLEISVLRTTFYACQSPFGNCQNYSINYFVDLIKINKELSYDIFIDIYSRLKKYQLVVDVDAIYLRDLEKRFKIFYESIQTMKYISTNGTPMVLCRIVLNTAKLNDLIITNYKFVKNA